jgi:hypothetical protein
MSYMYDRLGLILTVLNLRMPGLWQLGLRVGPFLRRVHRCKCSWVHHEAFEKEEIVPVLLSGRGDPPNKIQAC